MDSTHAMRALPASIALIEPASRSTPLRRPFGTNLARRLLYAKLDAIRGGRLVVHDDGRTLTLGDRGAEATEYNLHIRNPAFFTATVLGGHIGAAESYMLGDWDCDDLTGLLTLFVRNAEILTGLETGVARLLQPLRAVQHRLRRNTPRGSRLNIAAHYDLGNAFFETFLDPTMMYSCAIYDRPDTTLEEASIAKLERVCRKLDLRPTDHLVEIGTGWGGMALYAAQHFGCRVTTTTLSREQHAMATERIAKAGLQDRVSVVMQDYRELQGTYDKLVSIEMIEAVGHEFYGSYFETCSRLLKPTGRMLIQAITIDDRLYERAKREVDFIKRYIFPGSCIPSCEVLLASTARHTDLQLVHLEDITPHYARTLHDWHQRFEAANHEHVDHAFHRMWRFYFCYCEAGFMERHIGTLQLVWDKPKAFRPPILGTFS